LLPTAARRIERNALADERERAARQIAAKSSRKTHVSDLVETSSRGAMRREVAGLPGLATAICFDAKCGTRACTDVVRREANWDERSVVDIALDGRHSGMPYHMIVVPIVARTGW